ncbi:carboxypeptidase-like regulatory domain-containing protein [Pedobacter sp. UYP24]
MYAQKTITGRVFNKRTREAIPFATVSFLNTNKAAPADSKGVFKLILNNKDVNDTLLIAGVGYKQIKIAIIDFDSHFKVYLEEEIKTLKEVNISNKRRELQIGNFDISNNFSLGNWGVQVAKRFQMPTSYQYLKEIIIMRRLEYLQSSETKFRISIYDEDPATRGPGKKICLDTIEVTDLDNAKIRVNVSKYNISIVTSPFFVVIETLPIPYNERYFPHRVKKDIEGVRKLCSYYTVMYQPYLSLRDARQNEGWRLSLEPGSTWENVDSVPAINIVVN